MRGFVTMKNSLPMSTSTDPSVPTKDNPYSSKLLVNRLMTEGSDKETRHFELSLKIVDWIIFREILLVFCLPIARV